MKIIDPEDPLTYIETTGIHMPKKDKKTGSELFIVDNSDADWKMLNYLRAWEDIARAFDVAIGYFDDRGFTRA